jgi:hypothetical protein
MPAGEAVNCGLRQKEYSSYLDKQIWGRKFLKADHIKLCGK